MKTEEFLIAAMELSDTERVYLATRLLESVSDDVNELSVDDPGLYEELDRRAADLSGAIPAEDLWKKS